MVFNCFDVEGRKMTNPARTNADLIGVDVSGATMHAVLLSAQGQVIERREAALEREGVTAQVARVASELRDASRVGVAALGVGIPGLVNPETGNVII